MKRKELEEFKKRWEENLGGLGEMLNSPWFAVSIKYDEAEKNKCCIKTSLKRTAQSRLDSLYPPETPDEVEEDSYLTECGGWIVFNELDLELRLCEKHFPRANLVNRETYDKILEALVECNEKVIDCVSELCEIDCKMNGTNIEDCL